MRAVLAMLFAGTLATSTAHAGGVRYLALGDSYTIGERVQEPERWPVQLAARLSADGTEVAPPEIIARTGWTTDELSAALDAHPPTPPYGLVSLLIGVNNQYRGRPLDQYRTQFSALLERAIGYAGGDPRRVFVLSFPDWGVTRFGHDSGRDTAKIAAETDAFNRAAAEICRGRGVRFVDITPISRRPGAALAADGLHPGGAQYALWSDAALPVVRELLAAPAH